jgi:hypothetical protein
MLTFDRAARRIDRRSAAQVGQLWLAVSFGPTIRKYNKPLDNRRVPLWWTRVWSRTILRVGRARRAEWRERNAV